MNLHQLRYYMIDMKLREPLSILIKYKTIDTPKIDNILKIYFDIIFDNIIIIHFLMMTIV